MLGIEVPHAKSQPLKYFPCKFEPLNQDPRLENIVNSKTSLPYYIDVFSLAGW